MAQSVLASPAVGDAATIQAVGSETANQPATNLQTMQPSEIWRATTLGSAYTEWQLDRVRPIDFVGLLYHNMSADGTVRVRAASKQADLTANPAYDSGPQPARSQNEGITLLWSDEDDNPENYAYDRNHFLHFIDSEKTFEWWRIDAIDANNSAGYIQAGRAYLSRSFRPGVNMEFGWGVAWDDGQERTTARSGAIYPRQRTPGRRFTGKLRVQSKADLYDKLFQMQRELGSSKDLLVTVDKDNDDRLMDFTVCGLFTELQPIVNSNVDLYQANLTVTELL